MSPSPLLDRVGSPPASRRPAVSCGQGGWTYGELASASASFRRLARAAAGDLAGQRLAYLAKPGRTNVAVQLGAWSAGAAAVPLAPSHPLPELEYVLDDAEPAVVAASPALEQSRALLRAAKKRGLATLEVHEEDDGARAGDDAGSRWQALAPEDGGASNKRAGGDGLRADAAFLAERGSPAGTAAAFILYTSGTTGRPKGVVVTHENLEAQARSLARAWDWSAGDRILHVLPLHHVHGLVNALFCALWSGAACEFGSARPAAVWERWAAGGVTLFMAVPTIYARLVRAWEEAPRETRRRWSKGAAGLRLMVSGSAALPASTFERWREITGHELLERYGMTETGMTLSAPLAGPRLPGRVGWPLPGVEMRLAPEGGGADGEAGEIEVRGPQVSPGYWRRPEETAAAFRGSWFRTGDQARVGDGGYRIVGRRGSDVFKTGGHLVSAAEVEELYRTHPGVRDVAVAGVPDPEWGRRVCAAYVAEGGGKFAGDELRDWGKKRLAPYKVPREFKAVERLPRTPMGKVRKAAVARMFGAPPSGGG